MKPNNLSKAQIKEAERNSASYLLGLGFRIRDWLYAERYITTFYVNSADFITFKWTDMSIEFIKVLQKVLDRERIKCEIVYYYINNGASYVNIKFDVLESFIERVKV
jgi:hypothetical protein